MIIVFSEETFQGKIFHMCRIVSSICDDYVLVFSSLVIFVDSTRFSNSMVLLITYAFKAF